MNKPRMKHTERSSSRFGGSGRSGGPALWQDEGTVVWEEAEKGFGWELDCILEGWDATERFQQGDARTALQLLKIT